MDAARLLRRRAKNPFLFGLLIFLSLFPLAAGVTAKFTHHNWMLMDIDAVLCAAVAQTVGHSPYNVTDCAGLAPAPYVYAPQIAMALAPLVDRLGAAMARDLYVALLLVPATAFLLWYALFKTFPRLDPRVRWLALAAVPAMSLCCGNIGLVMHAVVVAAALVLPRRRLPFIAVVVACAVLKPTFLAYLVVLLLEDRPLRVRLATLVPAGAAGLAAIAATVVTAGPDAAAWRHALQATALDEQPGYGWLALTAWAGLASVSPITWLFTVGYSLAILASGLAVASYGRLDASERTLLGLGLTPLLVPRLMDYDILALVPFAALMITQVRLFGPPWLRTTVTVAFIAVLGLGILTNIAEYKPYHRTHVAMALFIVATLAAGLSHLIRIVTVRLTQPIPSLLPRPTRPAPSVRRTP